MAINCAIRGCEETAKYPFPAHNMNHGVLLKEIRKDLEMAYSGNDHNLEVNSEFKGRTPRDRYTVEQALHYQSFM